MTLPGSNNNLIGRDMFDEGQELFVFPTTCSEDNYDITAIFFKNG